MINKDRVLREENGLIDLLVDGELDTGRRRQLLQSLDRESDGWRRCALAFLEAQAWRDGLGSGNTRRLEESRPYPTPSANGRATSGLDGRVPQPHRVSLRDRAKLGRALSSLAALAAGLIVAFALGRATTGGFARPELTPQSIPKAVVVRSAIQAPSPSANEERDERTAPLDSPVALRPATKAISASLSPEAAAPALALTGLGLDPNWVRRPPTPLPAAIRGRIERRGYEVERRRRLVAVQLKNGQRVEVPVEETKLRFVGNHTF